jgi:hypothetical protein
VFLPVRSVFLQVLLVFFQVLLLFGQIQVQDFARLSHELPPKEVWLEALPSIERRRSLDTKKRSSSGSNGKVGTAAAQR